MSTRIVAIDGHGGAGKTSFAEHVAHALGGVSIVHTDDFASWDNPVEWWPRLIDELLRPIAAGEPARFKLSEWEPGQDRGWMEVEPPFDLVLEGVTASRDAFQRWLTYSIWLETPRELCIARGIARDGESARAQWEEWLAAEDNYMRRERPDSRADLVLRGDADLWT